MTDADLDRSGLLHRRRLCVDDCPELFIVFEDGIGYVRDGDLVIDDPTHRATHVPERYQAAVISAAERCPGECIYLVVERPPSPEADDHLIVDAEIVT